MYKKILYFMIGTIMTLKLLSCFNGTIHDDPDNLGTYNDDVRSDEYTNIAAGKQINTSDSYSDYFSGRHAIDGDLQTFWSPASGTNNDWFYIDLGRSVEIDGIGIHWLQKYYAQNFKIAVSDNLINWTYIDAESAYEAAKKVIYKKLECRYIGLLVLEKKNGFCALSEFEVYKFRDQVVSFNDKNFDAVVRSSLNKQKGELYKSELRKITELHGNNSNISDISGIEHCRNLEYLYLNDNAIVSIDPLFDLIKLKSIYLDNNHINNINPLRFHTDLEILSIKNNPVKNLSGINRETCRLIHDDTSKRVYTQKFSAKKSSNTPEPRMQSNSMSKAVKSDMNTGRALDNPPENHNILPKHIVVADMDQTAVEPVQEYISVTFSGKHTSITKIIPITTEQDNKSRNYSRSSRTYSKYASRSQSTKVVKTTHSKHKGTQPSRTKSRAKAKAKARAKMKTKSNGNGSNSGNDS